MVPRQLPVLLDPDRLHRARPRAVPGLDGRWPRVLGLVVGTLFMAFHASQGPQMGLPQMIQSRAQFGYRGVIVAALRDAVHLHGLQRRRPGAAGPGPERARSAGTPHARRRRRRRSGAAALAIYGHDWVHRAFRVHPLRLAALLTAVLTVGMLVGHGRRTRPAAHALRLHRGGVHGAVLGRRRLQHHLRALRVGLLALPAARRPGRSRSSRSVFFGAAGAAFWLIVARRLAGDPPRCHRRTGRAAARRQQRGRRISAASSRSCRRWPWRPPWA